MFLWLAAIVAGLCMLAAAFLRGSWTRRDGNWRFYVGLCLLVSGIAGTLLTLTA